MWKPPECTVSGGFFLLVGWFALCCGWQTALTVLGAAAWHEFGHLLALRLCGGEARRLRVGMLGAVIEVRGAMGYGQELASALAGPLANLLAAAVLGRMGCTTAAGANGVQVGVVLLAFLTVGFFDRLIVGTGGDAQNTVWIGHFCFPSLCLRIGAYLLHTPE